MIPLSLKILAVVAVILIVLFFVLKKRRKFIWPLIIIVIGLAVWQGLKEYNRTNKDLANVKADVKISSVDLIHEYELNDSSANQKYLDKVVETVGNIKKIEKDEKGYFTVVLGDMVNPSSVRCSMDTVHNEDAARLTAGSSATVRGMCTGFNKDEMGIGSDVILNRCAIIVKKDQ